MRNGEIYLKMIGNCYWLHNQHKLITLINSTLALDCFIPMGKWQLLITVPSYNSKIKAKRSSSQAAKISPQEMYGLEPTLLILKGALVMLTMNLWPSVGLCNGSTGTIVVILFSTPHKPPDLPIVVIVKFDNYIGPSISEKIPSLVAIFSCYSSRGCFCTIWQFSSWETTATT